MTAYPTIIDATGYYPGYYPGTVTMMALYENKKIENRTTGLIKFTPMKYEGGVCYSNPAIQYLLCAEVTEWNLKDKISVDAEGLGAFNFGCLEASYCPDAGCPSSCSKAFSRSDFEVDIPIRAYDSLKPNAPPNLTVTPQSGGLKIKWDPVTNVEIFAYHVTVVLGATAVAGGWAENTLREVTVGGLTNGTTYTVEVFAISHSNIISDKSIKTGTPQGAPDARIFNFCWGVGETAPCPIPPENPPVYPDQNLNIIMDIANSGPSGRVRGVIKVGTTIADKETTLAKYPEGGLFSVTGSYTMPSTNITIVFEAYGWDGTKWVMTHTLTQTLVPSQINCTSLSLDPFTASIKVGEKVTFTATVTPATTQFDVQFKDRAGTILGTCKTSGGSCTFIWDSAGKSPGTYYVKAYVSQGNCTSLESVITLSPAIRQWDVNIYVKDQNTGNPIQGASVTIGTQSKTTDATGFVTFRVDEGTIYITIVKEGYSTVTDVRSIFSDTTLNYSMPPVAAKGNIHFVTIPEGAEVFIDNVDQGVKTNVTVTNIIPAGEHTFTLKLSGYNDFTGKVTVIGGSTVDVYAVLTPSGAGALYVTSTPAGAEVFLDNVDQGVTTPATITDLTPGSHEVKLTRTGYQDYTATVTITAGVTTYLSATLTVLPGTGTLEISSTPSGARVFIDGKDAERVTPATITSLSSGEHAFKLVLSGYEEAKGTFTIEPGKTTTVTVTMKKVAIAGTSILLVLGVTTVAIAAVVAMR